MDFALLRKKPVLRISSSSAGNGASDIAFGVGYAAKSAGVARFTRTSVHCAERIVATSSSHALRWFSAQTALGYAFSSPSRIAAIRSGASGFAVLPRFAFAETG